MNVPEICRYCGGKVIFTDAKKIYENGTDKIYLCTNCNAYVGVHKGTNRPLGKLANAALRMKRRETHTFFDAFWQAQNITRAEAYRLLARELGVPERKAHIGNMEMDDCQRVIDFCCKNQIKKEAC